MIHIAKYAFTSKEQFNAKFEALHTIDEEGNSITDFKFEVVQLGNIQLEAEVLDEDGEIESEAVVSEKWHVDAIWFEQEDHPYGWKSYNEDLSSEGLHGFSGVSYLANKF